MNEGRKAFMGVRLRRLREERGLTQAALATALGLSNSYLSQLEKNQRPLTVPVLLKIRAVLGIDFAEVDETRLIADLREALAEAGTGESVAVAEIRELAASMPAVGRALVSLHGRYRQALERAQAMAGRPGDDGPGHGRPPTPLEEVRDFFHARHNHVAELDAAAERLYARARLRPGSVHADLAAYLAQRHGLRIAFDAPEDNPGTRRRYDRASRVLHLAPGQRPGQHAFHMATQLAFLEMDAVLQGLTDAAAFTGAESRALARIGLAHYFAGALILPYGAFLRAAEALRYDIERLGREFGVGFETVCHRLSTLQRPEAQGVPFFFVRVDRAGNISKRHSATDFPFARVGGSCPLWNVYEAFAHPGRILTQLAQMPDGHTTLWVARTVTRGHGQYGAPGKTFSIGLGCDVRHASRLVYASGLDLENTRVATPIGAGCRICERPACPQRAFPPIGRPLAIDENHHRFVPYPTA